MSTIAHTAYLDSEFGVPCDLEPAGSALENPFVYDSSARELKSMAAQGLVQIVSEHMTLAPGEPLIDRISFVRMR